MLTVAELNCCCRRRISVDIESYYWDGANPTEQRSDMSNQTNSAPDCEFCSRLIAGSGMEAGRPWYDFHVLFETPDFVAIPALGSIVPGYLLLVSKRHIPSMALLGDQELSVLKDFLFQLVQFQEQHWGKVVVFEHGACTDNSQVAGSCINHAHWHIVPIQCDLLPGNINFLQFESFSAFARQYSRKRGYLFFQRQENIYCAEVEAVASQLFRRKLARIVGCPDEWDYIAYPFLENMRETINKLIVVQSELRATIVNDPTIKAYEAIAHSYYLKTSSVHTYNGHPQIIDKFISLLNGERVLDAGCGSCRDSAYFLSKALQVEAIDLAKNLLLVSAASCPNMIKRVMDVRKLAYADHVFDGIWCSAVLLHLNSEDVLQALKEFHRVLKPGGILHISLKKGQGEYRSFIPSNPVLYRQFYLYNEAEVQVQLLNTGFEITSSQIVSELDSGGQYVDWLRFFAAA